VCPRATASDCLSWDAGNRISAGEITVLSYDLKIHYRVCKSLVLGPILGQIPPVHCHAILLQDPVRYYPQWAVWRSVNAHALGRILAGKLALMTWALRGFPSSLQANVGMADRLGDQCFLPDPFRFIILPLNVIVLATDSVVNLLPSILRSSKLSVRFRFSY
jgi:hypothetical protein